MVLCSAGCCRLALSVFTASLIIVEPRYRREPSSWFAALVLLVHCDAQASVGDHAVGVTSSDFDARLFWLRFDLPLVPGELGPVTSPSTTLQDYIRLHLRLD